MNEKYKILDNIKKIATKKRMSLEKLSSISGIEVEKILSMNDIFPSIDKLQKIGDVLGTTTYFLVNGEELPEGTIIVMGDNGREVLTGEKAKKFLKIFEELSSEDNQVKN